MSIAGWIIEGVLFVFIGFLWVRFMTDWVQVFARSWEPRGVVLVFLEAAYSATDPPINALRKVIKPIRIGNFALDLSFILVMILAYVLLTVNRSALLA
ncbi:YggT family protein [Nocardioides sp. zg-536]|uniref:YggT family protein n=1 Tax=Nocardioides faecalis TaxID=2803858 RepID=A0A938Y1K4_9ACTN|nr:YggT family protein [Nocardioides faecalis]MBM9460487.1 YggT family protein [Nocardioides faecalis]MBS4752268.1 YggT family protein [Nocardioides faecalis]QVI57576.1 YggT family protein [Nocardioides faecalis]